MNSKKFDAEWYLRQYPDVAKGKISPLEHYETFGKSEGRFPCKPTVIDYVAVASTRLKNTSSKLFKSLLTKISNLLKPVSRVNAEWYLQNNPDVAASGISAKEHYKHFGRAEGRLPCPPNTLDRLIARVRVSVPAIRYLAATEGGYTKAINRLLTVYKTDGYIGLKHFVVRTFRAHENRNRLSYADWIKENELSASDSEQARAKLAKLPKQPLISIIMPTYNSNLIWLEEAIESIRIQPYENWELCIADDASPNKNVAPFLEQWSKRDSRIKYVIREKNGHISEASNSAIDLATGEWLALFDHDDLFHPFALYWVVLAINEYKDSQLIYSDEDKIDEQGERQAPYFKPAWNYDLFLSQNCFSHLGLIKKDLAISIGGFRKGFEGSQDHDLILRAIEKVNDHQIIHIPKVLYHWRVHAESTAKSSESKPYAALAGERAISEHLQRKGRSGKVSFEGYGYRVQYQLPAKQPLVSLIIPTRNGLDLLRQCLDSIIKKTTYKNYEFIIVDNGSDDPETLQYLNSVKKWKNARVIRDDRPFNYSQLNNVAAKEARGEILGLINNDIEVIEPDWLGEMVSHVLRPEVGAVGAKLLFPNNTLQHGGVVLGVGGVANHAHLYIPRQHHGYFARASLIQQFSAVTAACLLVRKSVYEEASGLDEVNLVVAFNDVDFCIRLKKLGYNNIWTPYAELYHHESATRGQDIAPEKRARFVREVNYMMDTWGKDFLDDPAYNPNLNLDFPDFALSAKKRLDKWELGFPISSNTHEQLSQ
ncbi:glycosyltransferase family 2 protein [Cellvibrio sp. NN19]|uniref:glycosyltransferase family 2 protein n=1 Tax=Cellvibrio chitinivorans TaxID=3102792 RepID=UPI002B40B82C|nr:glycosyltransferase family 2 protein [Cellvibrio sp. NN19]